MNSFEETKVVKTESSPKAKRRIETHTDSKGVSCRDSWALVPVWELHIGESFLVQLKGINESSVRCNASAQAKREGKKVTVIKHNNSENPLGCPCLEIARIG